MKDPAQGRTTVDFLLARGRLELVDVSTASLTSALIMDRARKRLRTAAAGLEVEDAEGAFAAAYDAYRMAADALLACQGLRATGGDGSHVTVEDAVSAQFSAAIPAFVKPTFERFRRMRHAAQYFDPQHGEIMAADAAWALATAQIVITAVELRLTSDPPSRFS